MLRPALPRIGRSLRPFRRSLHSIPVLTQDFNNGIPDFLSPSAFDMAWNQYQGLMLEKLNYLIAGGEFEHKSTKDIAIKYARDPIHAPTFNYASMAHNNHFFFNCLSSTKTPMPTNLKKELERSFSSIATLQKTMILTASSMFGPGFVWLVQTKDTNAKRFQLLTTYLAGSPYPGAHFRRQSQDMNTGGQQQSSGNLPSHIMNSEPVNIVGAHGPLSKKALAPGGVDLTPVLCINTWDHVYLPDYGIGAKKTYAECWWERINWDVVAGNANLGSRGAYMVE